MWQGERGRGAANAGSIDADERGVSEVLGAVLVFGLVLSLLALVQLYGVPATNEEVEFRHSERVQGDVGRLSDALSRVATTGAAETTTVETGLRYPPRLLFFNPPPVSGSLRTEQVGSGAVSLSNVRATDPETADYVDGSLSGFETRSLVYSADYNRYRNAPETVYGTGVLYNRHGNGRRTVANPGNLVSGNRISLVLVDGQLATTSVGDTSVSVEPLSAPARTVSVTGDGGDVTLTVPTELSAETWETEILAGEENVVTVDQASGDAVEIVLDGSETYNLRMAEVGVGSGYSAEGAHYVTTVSGGEDSVLDSGSEELVVEVRDRFNNPVSGVTVPMRVDSNAGTFEQSGTNEVTVTTDEDGRASVTFEPKDLPSGATQNWDVQVGGDLDFDGDGAPDFDPNGNEDSEAYEDATFSVEVVDPDATGSGSGGSNVGSNINPHAPVVVEEALTSGQLSGGGGEGGYSIQCANNGCLTELTLKKQGDGDATITEMRFNAYIASSGPGIGGRGLPDNVRVTDDTCSDDATLSLQGSYQSVPFGTIEGGDTKSLSFRFDDGNYENVEGDAFLVSVKYDLDGDGTSDTSATYLVTPIYDSDVSDPCS